MAITSYPNPTYNGGYFTPIATYTLSSTISTYTFSSIPQTYLDLVIVCNLIGDTTNYVQFRYNGDTGANYDRQILSGSSGGGVSAWYDNAQTYISPNYHDSSNTNYKQYSRTEIFGYAGSKYKTSVTQGGSASGLTIAGNTWRSTAAITSITLITNSGNFTTGSTVTIYGYGA